MIYFIRVFLLLIVFHLFYVSISSIILWDNFFIVPPSDYGKEARFGYLFTFALVCLGYYDFIFKGEIK